MEGVVYAPEGRYYVEPLQNYLPSASNGELVIYRQADIKPGEALKCGVSLPMRIQRGAERVTAQTGAATSTTPTKYVFEVATEADYEYVQALGGPEEANREIEGILNHVEGVYQSELLLQLRISFQNAWKTEDDPYTATNTLDLVIQFANYWNTHYADTENYDIAHLWTDRKRDDGGINGRAYLGVACGSPAYSYGMSTRQTALPDKYVTPAHEIGHNFGAVHPDELNPPVAACHNTVMHSGGIVGGGNRYPTFCQFSRQQIAEHVAGNNSCLGTQEITLQPPTGLMAAANSESSISLAWRDSNTIETGFVVQRRREGSGDWIQVGTTAADVTTLSSGGLFSEATYIFRVQAFNDEESSAWSNEAEATTLAGQPPVSDWVIDTVAGRRDEDDENGPALQARLEFPNDVAVDPLGNVYIADGDSHRVRRVDTDGTITTVAGTGKVGYGGDGGPADEALLWGPNGVAVDDAGNLYVADSGNHRIRRVDPTGTITTVAGTGTRGNGGDAGPAIKAQLSGPSGVAVDNSGNLYIADTYNQQVRHVNPEGIITTVTEGLHTPTGLALDRAGNLYIAESQRHRILRVDRSGAIATIAGSGESGDKGDGGPAVAAQLFLPAGVAVDGGGNLYIADTGSDRIRRVDESGIITTVAGGAAGGDSRGYGPAVEAALNSPSSVAVDSTGAIYIADRYNNAIRRVDESGIITTIAGSGRRGHSGDGGRAIEAEFHWPIGIAVDRSGNVYVSDTENHRVRVLTRASSIPSPTGLKATAVSFREIKLTWQDNSTDEAGFRIQRRRDGSARWVEIGTTAANATSFSDTGLKPNTTVHYRVRAFRRIGFSDFSNEAMATTAGMAPTVIGFAPTGGPAGTRVTVAGTGFLGALVVGEREARCKWNSQASHRQPTPQSPSEPLRRSPVDEPAWPTRD